MEFRKHQHVERFGNTEVDGTNASVWLGDNGEVKAGGRYRELSLEKDNAGFYNWVIQQENIKQYLLKHPNHRLYGEWLVPHSLRTYRDDVWRNLYIFDVVVEHENDEFEYLSYDTYKPLLEEFNETSRINHLQRSKVVMNT